MGLTTKILAIVFGSMMFTLTWRLFEDLFEDPKYVLMLFTLCTVTGWVLAQAITYGIKRENRAKPPGVF